MRHRVLPAVAVCLLVGGCGSACARYGNPSAGGSAGAASSGGAPSVSPSPAQSLAGTQSCHDSAPAPSFMGGELTGVQFVTPRQGWVVGLREILATADGGTTWSVQDRGRLNLTSVDFISSTHGWAVGENVLLRTTDGRSWTTLPQPCPFLRAVHFVTPAIGFAIAGGSNLMDLGQSAPAEAGKLLATYDGGSTWHTTDPPGYHQTR